MMSRPIKYSPVITEGRDWGMAEVAGHRIRLWANLTTGRVVVQTDEAAPKDVGVAIELDNPIQPSLMLVNSQQSAWADDLRAELLAAATERYAAVASAGWESDAV